MTSTDTPEPHPAPPAPPRPPPPRRFLRTREDRYIAGVAGGLGRAFGVDPIIFRILLPALVFVGCLGLLIYAIAVVFVPSDDGTGAPAVRGSGGTLRRLAVIGTIVLGALAAAGVLFWGSAWATAAGAGVAVAVVVLALGVALVVGAQRGDRRARWLALPALLLAFPATVVAATDISLDGGTGERTYHPVASDRLPAGYRLGVGELVVDLRDLDWSGGRHVRLSVDVSAGHALVLVPESVCVSTRTRMRAGWSDVLGRTAAGFDVDQDVQRAAAGTPTLDLDAHVRVGAFEVRHRRRDHSDRALGPRRSGFDSGRENRETVADAACAGAPQ